MMKSRAVNANTNGSRLNYSTFSNKGSDISDIMSMTTIKNSYAIQSRPHEMIHTKNAFKDYFSIDHDEEEIQEEQLSHRPLNSEVKKNTQSHYNIYSDQKNKLANVVKECCNQKLKSALELIKSTKVTSTVRKLPTFSQNNIQRMNNPQQPMALISSLVGRISKQVLTSPKSKPAKTASKLRFSSNEEIRGNKSIPITNKLLLIQGISHIESYESRFSPEKMEVLETPKKRFSILNSQ